MRKASLYLMFRGLVISRNPQPSVRGEWVLTGLCTTNIEIPYFAQGSEILVIHIKGILINNFLPNEKFGKILEAGTCCSLIPAVSGCYSEELLAPGCCRR